MIICKNVCVTSDNLTQVVALLHENRRRLVDVSRSWRDSFKRLNLYVTYMILTNMLMTNIFVINLIMTNIIVMIMLMTVILLVSIRINL